MTISLRRAGIGGLITVAAALGVLVMLALPGLARGEEGSDTGDRSNGRENAGKVASYDAETGELTIDLRSGGSVSALVDDETRLRCVGPNGRKRGHRGHQHRGRGRGHDEDPSATTARRGRKGSAGESNRRHGHRCTTDALVEGAIVRKARIDGEEGSEVFRKVLLSKPKRDCDDDASDEGGEDQPNDS